MKIKIPNNFEKKLIGDYRSYIDNIISIYSSIIQDNKLEFFAEFTDHGLEHIEDVLNTASSLIDDRTLNLLNTKDITVLIASIVLHDVGMHISSEGLKTILNNKFDCYRIKYFDNKTWSEEWKDFIYEAKRFNDEQLDNIFGYSEIQIIEPDLDNLNDNSRKLCGEFIRRHHARLAHEIAFSGFPSKKGFTNVIPESKLEEEIIDLCGLVARSHGINLRNSFDYLMNKHLEAWKTPYGIKSVFLMIVLRISDYIQIHSERANPILVKTKRFSSPISKKEWEKHNSIKDINIKTDDPERIFITAKPQNSLVFLELKSLFNDIQYEFDISWAVLGEVYGKDEELKDLKIKFRRITSNIDNIGKFEETVDFIPERIKFDADSELLKLLIGPLYGEDPKYGIRELLQNSVDAVKERSSVENLDDSKIILSLNQDLNKAGDYNLTIQDNGVGMTKDTIINFFFRAGASFRNSMLWKKDFVKEDEVIVEKTGRFGVGVLAAFLLGEEFELWTKHYNDDKGYYCKASLSTKQVELLKNDCEIGTILKIKLSNKNINQFKNLITLHNTFKSKNRYFYDDQPLKLDWFNWYFMDSPKIEYNIDDEKLRQIFNFSDLILSSVAEKPSKGWYSFSTNEFKSVQWTIHYNSNERKYEYRGNENKINELYCNGFRILRGYEIPNFPWELPIVSAFDGNAKMPLSLSRDYLLNDRLPFEDNLVEDICLTIINKLHETDFEKIDGFWVAKENILNFYKYKIDLSKFIIVKGDEFTLLAPFIFHSLKIQVFYQLWVKKSGNENYIFSDNETFYQCSSISSDPNYFYKDHLDPVSYKSDSTREWFSLGEIKRREGLLTNCYILNDKLAYMSEKNRLTVSFKNKYKSTLYNNRWSVIKKSKIKEETYNYSTESRKKLEERIKKMNLKSKIVKNKITDDTFYFLKENFISEDEFFSFDKFKMIWEKIYGVNDYLIPVNKKFRKKI